MQTDIMAQLTLIMPELLLALAAVALLLIGAFAGRRSYVAVTVLAAAALLGAIALLIAAPLSGLVFGGALVLDSFGRFMKILALIAAFAVLVMATGAARAGKFDKFEFPVLVLLASLAMLLMISAGNLLSLYLGLELHALALYVMAALDRNNARSTEAGLKYFILGSLASGLLLYGMSLLYGYSGHIDFAGLSQALKVKAPPLGLILGVVFVLAGLTFKISAVPFHMWTPDVYEGAPAPVTAFFATASKIAAVALLTRLIVQCFGAAAPGAAVMPAWQQILIFMAVASMFLGALAGIAQRNIKRLMAYSSIAHIGYILAGLAAGTAAGVAGVLLYVTVYAAMMLGCFAFILAMRSPQDGFVEQIDDVAGLARANPFMAGIMTLLMFSLAGMPPLSGFFGKWYVFAAAVQAHLAPLAVAGMIAAAIAAFYYLRVIKLMWFDAPKGNFLALPRELRLILLLSGLFTLFYFLIGAWIQPWAAAAAQSLF